MEFTEEQINKIIIDAIDKREIENQYGIARVPAHIHNGVDSSQLSPDESLLGFTTVKVADATVAPIDKGLEGTIRFQYDSTHWRFWVRINNLWKSVALA